MTSVAPRRDQPITENGFITKRFAEYLEGLTRASNSASTTIESQTVQAAMSQALAARVSMLEAKQEVVVLTSSSITAKPFETVVCSNASLITVTLTTTPMKGDIINIKRTNGPVTVAGQIDGDTNKLINLRYYSIKLVYNGTDWSEI